MKEFKNLEKKLGISFKKNDLLAQAFCHRSYLNENPDSKLENNERLEFLGDAVIELIVTESLYLKYPKNPEGELTSWRASLVNAKKLSEIASKLEFNDYLLLSKGEAKEMGKARQYILANTFESFVGAVYLDRGYKVCEQFIKKHLLPDLPEIIEKGLHRDSKSLFQERAQEETGITPLYKVLRESGPDHAKHFTIGVFLDKSMIAEGSGFSKQEAEEAAAKNALNKK
ncbi:MAG: ribonuclease III [Candidatus Nealsonbacteria bacterium]